MDLPPNFEKAIQMHTATKTSEINEFKQPSTAAVLLGITEKVFARVTGSVLVSQSNASGKKINIGLQLKIRGLVSSLSAYFSVELYAVSGINKSSID